MAGTWTAVLSKAHLDQEGHDGNHLALLIGLVHDLLDVQVSLAYGLLPAARHMRQSVLPESGAGTEQRGCCLPCRHSNPQAPTTQAAAALVRQHCLHHP